MANPFDEALSGGVATAPVPAAPANPFDAALAQPVATPPDATAATQNPFDRALDPQRHATALEKVMDFLATGNYASAGAASALLKGENPLEGIGKGIRDKTNYGDVLDEHGVTNPWIKMPVGLALDIFLDPVTYTGAGTATKAGAVSKGLTIAGDVARLGGDAEKAMAIGGELSKVGGRLGATMAEQGAKGQRAALSFAGKSVLPSGINEAVLGAGDKIGDALGRTQVAQALRKAFISEPHLVGIQRDVHMARKAVIDAETRRALRSGADTFRPLQQGIAKVAAEHGLGARDVERALSNAVEMSRNNATTSTAQDILEGVEEATHIFGTPAKQALEPHVREMVLQINALNAANLSNEFGAGLAGTNLADSAMNYLFRSVRPEASEALRAAGFLPEEIIPKLTDDFASQHARGIRGELLTDINAKVERGEMVVGGVRLPAIPGGLYEENPMVATVLRSGASAKGVGSTNLIQDYARMAGRFLRFDETVAAAPAASGVVGRMEAQAAINAAASKVVPAAREAAPVVRRTRAGQGAVNAAKRELELAKNTGDIGAVGQAQEALAAAEKNAENMRLSADAVETQRTAARSQAASRVEQQRAAAAGLGESIRREGSRRAIKGQAAAEQGAREAASRVRQSSRTLAERELAEKWTAEGYAPVTSTARGMEGLWLPKQVADAINAAGDKIHSPGYMLRNWDASQQVWKNYTLGIFPMYHTRNLIGDFYNAVVLGGMPVTKLADGAGLMWGSHDNKIWRIGGGNATGKSLLALAEKHGVTDPNIRDLFEEIGAMQRLPRNVFDAAGQAVNNNAALRLGNKVGAFRENSTRMGLFLHRLEQGDAPEVAAMFVKEHLFDYSQLTTFERTVMRRIFPFYSFTRKNAPLQLGYLLKKPGALAGVEKLRNEAAGPEGLGVGEGDLPRFLRQGLPMRVGSNAAGDPQFAKLEGLLTAADVQNAFDPGQAFQKAVGLTSPFIKTPFEMMSNLDTFKSDLGSGKFEPMERFPGERENILGIPMEKRGLGAILSNVRPVTELNRLNPGNIFGTKEDPGWFGAGTVRDFAEADPAARAINMLAGRVYPINAEDQAAWSSRDTSGRVRELQRMYVRAMSRNDTANADILRRQIEALTNAGE